MAHTPGPWTVREDDWKGSKVVGPRGEYALALVYRQPKADGTYRYDAEANAHLIAAAPDLLEACKALLMSADCAWENNNLGHDWPEACEQARAAIASATKER